MVGARADSGWTNLMESAMIIGRAISLMMSAMVCLRGAPARTALGMERERVVAMTLITRVAQVHILAKVLRGSSTAFISVGGGIQYQTIKQRTGGGGLR